jgi:2-dehydropantoate 2-reductase
VRCKGLCPEIVRRIAIVGSGAIGCYYGARLVASGADVRFLARSGYSALKERGLRVKSPDGDLQLGSVQAFFSAEDIGPVDLVILAWKTTSNELC